MNALYVICGLGFVALLAEIANLRRMLAGVITIGLVAAAALMVMDWDRFLMYYNDMIVFDNTAVAFSVLIIVLSFFWFWMAGDYFTMKAHQTDRSALVLFSIVGAVIMVSFNNMAMLFLGIEIMSMSLYVMAGSNKESLFSNEAAFKYFLMGSFATGFLLMGIALVYGATGQFHITKIIGFLAEGGELPKFFYAGILMMMVGLAFKVSAVPFHFWAPDVYEGSPVSVTAFMSTVVKVAAVGAFYKIMAVFFSIHPVPVILQVITVLSLVVPNVTAVYQTSVKRMLAYSSVGHIGYIMLAFISGGGNSISTLFFYLSSYAISSIAAFSVLKIVEKSGEGDNAFRGLSGKSPWLAFVMTVSMLSLAGIPPLAGFFAKYMVFVQALNHDHSGLVILAVITSLIGVFYYFRVIIDMYGKGSSKEAIQVSFSTKLLMFILVALILLMGIFPDQLIALLGV